ncbi:Hypothetical protein FKW44_009239 [Caligus rogercresseyi]|uniref:Uncharacterized protein n=1 Tax=Caligus rogercresseyi TaxID=217165 RepID=A0A7T8HF25_CALRO|nr:Hypothetical protein FKW44_009239 [Caligus rogercresseyi]
MRKTQKIAPSLLLGRSLSSFDSFSPSPKPQRPQSTRKASSGVNGRNSSSFELSSPPPSEPKLQLNSSSSKNHTDDSVTCPKCSSYIQHRVNLKRHIESKTCKQRRLQEVWS